MRLVQVAQYSSDLDRSSAFYSDLLGIAPVARFDPPGLLFFDAGSSRLLFDVNATPTVIYVEVDSIDGALDRIGRSGHPIERAAHVIFSHADATLGPAGMDEWHAFVRDPDGNLVGLVEFRPRADVSASGVKS